MLMQLFGLLDMLAGFLLILSRFGYESSVLILVGALLIIKSLFFFGGVVSLVDILGALMMILIVFMAQGVYPLFVLLFSLWFLQKGFFSFVPS